MAMGITHHWGRRCFRLWLPWCGASATGKAAVCLLVGHITGFGTLRFGLPTMGCILRDREEEKLSFAALLLGYCAISVWSCLQGGLGAELWVQYLR